MLIILSTIFAFFPDITINDHHVSVARFLAAVGTIFVAGGALFAAVMYRIDFWRGRDIRSVEMLGVAHEERGVTEGENPKPKYMLTADVWGNHNDVDKLMGKQNKRLAAITVKAISSAPDEKPYVCVETARSRRWITGRLDAMLDGNDWAANAARVKRRPTNNDRFGCCFFAPRDPIDHIKSGVVIVFDDESASVYADETFPARCDVADPWMENVPKLLHLAAIAWLDRKVNKEHRIVWTVAMATTISPRT